MNLHINDYLQISYLKEEIGTNDVSINSDKSYEEYETRKHKYIFDPEETGQYTIEYNNKSITVDVYDNISISESNWIDQSQSSTTPYRGTPAYVGSDAIQIDANPGTSTNGELITNNSYKGSNYSLYLQKKRDTGGQNNVRYSLIDPSNGRELTISSSGYGGDPDVQLSEYDETGSRINNWSIGDEMNTDEWFKSYIKLDGRSVVANWGSNSDLSVTTTHNFDSSTLKFNIGANGWGGGDYMYVAFDNFVVK